MAQRISVLRIDVVKLVFHVIEMDKTGAMIRLWNTTGERCEAFLDTRPGME